MGRKCLVGSVSTGTGKLPAVIPIQEWAEMSGGSVHLEPSLKYQLQSSVQDGNGPQMSQVAVSRLEPNRLQLQLSIQNGPQMSGGETGDLTVSTFQSSIQDWSCQVSSSR
ncbi:hypothetical protein AVEN_233861-1 [Araneus ventricosus]|uniref:Uncharacterized protein n=1 Tax=Araneus ventricosus TaxID=182803 RepID=A0A4Y2VHT9_ARAVE|nr:hypothetical protein AVEN_233861-1 [Araneus ventricosus]